MLELKKSQQTPADELRDRVYSAMETGNPGAARVALAEASPELVLQGVVTNIQFDVLHTYGIRL